MMRKWTLVPALLLLPLVLIGCGNGNGEDKELLLEDVASEGAQVWCAWLYGCCTDDEITRGNFAFTNETECVTKIAETITDNWVTPMQAAIDAGTATYDAKKAYKCLEASKNLGCTGTNTPSDFLDNCDESPRTGTVAAGSECASYVECVAAAPYCTGTPEVCTAPLAKGDTCTVGALPLCEAGTYCDSTTTQCTDFKAEGDDCTTTTECGALSCVDNKCATACTGR
jgi:hypothetical protein